MTYEILFLVGRILFGGYFLMMGVNHFKKTQMMMGYAQMRGAPASRPAIQLSGLVLILGGLGILLGVAVEIAILLLVLFLLGASFSIHHFWKDTDPQVKMNEMVNFMKNMALVGATLMLLAISLPWPLSL